MPLTLIRRPRSSRVMHNEVKREVRPAMESIGQYIVQLIEEEIRDWKTKPTFKVAVTLGKVWKLVVRYDRRTKIGQIFGWVDQGTGRRGNKPGGKAYDITPKKAKAFEFDVPYAPMTMPKIAQYEVHGGGPAHIITKVVHMPGINPRDFTTTVRKDMKNRNNPRGFPRTIDNAIRRGIRRIGKRR